MVLKCKPQKRKFFFQVPDTSLFLAGGLHIRKTQVHLQRFYVLS